MSKPEEQIDKVAVVKAWVSFKDKMREVFDKASSVVVDLQFESSQNNKTHHNFPSDEIIFLQDIKINEFNNKVIFVVPSGVKGKTFYYEEAEGILVTDAASVVPLNEVISTNFKEAFADQKISSIMAIQVMVKNVPELLDILNDPDKFLGEIEKSGQRTGLYAKLERFGRY